MVGEVPSGDATNVEVSEGLAETAEESGADKKKGSVAFVCQAMYGIGIYIYYHMYIYISYI